MIPTLIIKRLAVSIGLVLIFGLTIQLFYAKVENPPVTGKFEGPKEVTDILERSCYSCHSNETKLGWINKVAPISWLVASDVANARKVLNFSEWDKLTPGDQKVKKAYMLNMVKSGRMPLPRYTAIHPEAKISKSDLDILTKYVLSLNTGNPADTSGINAADREYNNWKKKQIHASNNPVSPNGIKYFDDYKNWDVINTTYRKDSNTIRVLHGNAIAVKAIKNNTITPWPDGAIIVKVVWNEIEDKDGNARPGTFNNVQIMIKDSKKYTSTEGWGFAKFETLDRKPYGKDVDFAISCINCHRLADKEGYVFDAPLKINPKQFKWYEKN